MKTILAAAILFPITFLIFSYLFEDSPVNGNNNFDCNLVYNIECQYNTAEESSPCEIIPPLLNQLK